jgi:hypothetical protein
MPYLIRPKRVRQAVVGLVASALFLAAVPAVAGASSCASSAVSQPFAQFNDSAHYSLLSGGSFESGAGGWSLTNSTVANGNESYHVAGGTHSLAIQPNGQAVSPAFCVSSEYPSFRFFARQTSGSWAVLNVILRWTDSSGATHETTSGALQTGTSWAVSPIMQLGSELPVQDGTTVSVKLVFKPEQYGGAWAIDDVYIDPYSR